MKIVLATIVLSFSAMSYSKNSCDFTSHQNKSVVPVVQPKATDICDAAWQTQHEKHLQNFGSALTKEIKDALISLAKSHGRKISAQDIDFVPEVVFEFPQDNTIVNFVELHNAVVTLPDHSKEFTVRPVPYYLSPEKVDNLLTLTTEFKKFRKGNDVVCASKLNVDFENECFLYTVYYFNLFAEENKPAVARTATDLYFDKYSPNLYTVVKP